MEIVKHINEGNHIGAVEFSIMVNPESALKVLGPRLNIKTVLSAYGNFHVKDKTAVRTSYL